VVRLIRTGSPPSLYRVRVHPNTARFHLDALVGAGRAERVPARATRSGRPRELFQAVICDLHLGFVQGTPQRLRALVSIVRLIPVAEAEACRLVLATTHDQPGTPG
jgi:hypothetical protein